jgi:predicted nucleic acid-binding protein
MNSSIFIDTSALIAIMNKKDQYHARAIDIFTAIVKGNNNLIITSHIFAETITRIERKVSAKQAILAGKMLLNNNGIKIIIPQEGIIDNAWNIFQKYQDQEFSFVDCISFAVMKEMRITKAFAFDKHFKIIGFETL